MTYGALRLQIKKLTPDIDQEILDGFIADRYQQILDRLSWKRLESESIIAAPDSYSIGTITATEGSTAITGLGTAWTAAMTGRMIRINSGQEYYRFTYVSATTGTLDRAYEGSTGSITASAVAVGGTGYLAGDAYAVAGGNGLATGTIGSVSGGVVTSIIPGPPGAGYSVASGVATTTSGSGTGLTINITAVSPGSGLTYRIDQNIWTLPTGARVLRAVTPLHGGRALEMITTAELNRRFPNRGMYGGTYGEPQMAAATWDSPTDPPLLQVELYPVPTSPDSTGIRRSWSLDLIIDPSLPAASATSLLPWVRTSALKNGVLADVRRWQDNMAAALAYEQSFKDLVIEMAMVNAEERGPQALRLARELQRNKPSRWRRGPWHEGSNG